MFVETLSEALRSAFGSFGSANCHWSAVSFDVASNTGIVRVRPEDLAQLRFAVTLITRCEDHRCRVDVLAAAPSLAALACTRLVDAGVELAGADLGATLPGAGRPRLDLAGR